MNRDRKAILASILTIIVVLPLGIILLLLLGQNSTQSQSTTTHISDNPIEIDQITQTFAFTITPTNTPTSTIAPSPTLTIAPTPAPTDHPWIEQQIRTMSLEEKVGQMIMTSVGGQAISSYSCSIIQRLRPGGIVYLGINAGSPYQLSQLSIGVQNCSEAGGGIPLLIAIDHEGQYVNRFDANVTIFPPAMAQGATGNPDLSYQIALAAGQELAYGGVNMVLGPVGDVLINYDNTVISQRSFHGDPYEASRFVGKAVEGYLQAGLVPVIKHFPGHGGVSYDSHFTLPIDEVNATQLEEIYLPPFQSGLSAGAQIVMMSHVAFPSIDDSIRPASLSAPTLDLLRGDLDFQGMIITDVMEMGAIVSGSTSIAEASEEAVMAGVDMLLITSPEQALATWNRIINAVREGRFSTERIDASIKRILTVKANAGLIKFPLPEPIPPDWAANREISFNAGYRAVALLRDVKDLVPIPGEVRRIFLIGPTDAWGLYPILISSMIEAGLTIDQFVFSGPWRGPIPETGYLSTLPSQAILYDLTIVLTWEAHVNRLRYGDTWQSQLVNSLILLDTPVIVVSLKSPTDILEFPEVPTYLSTFGTTRGQIQALAHTLVGKWMPTGVNPLSGLPLQNKLEIIPFWEEIFLHSND